MRFFLLVIADLVSMDAEHYAPICISWHYHCLILINFFMVFFVTFEIMSQWFSFENFMVILFFRILLFFETMLLVMKFLVMEVFQLVGNVTLGSLLH